MAKSKISTNKYKRGISVILPTFKGEKWITRCFNSLANQTINKQLFEVIIIVNGEKDHTSDLIDTFQKIHSDLNINLIELSKSGASYARNEGIKLAEREYITFLDDDDWISENYLELLYEKRSKDTIVCSSVIDVDEQGKHNSSNYINNQLNEYLHKKNIKYYEIKNAFAITCAKLLPAHYIKSLKFEEDLKNGEDIVYFAKLLMKYEFKLKIVLEATYYRFVRKQSISRQQVSYSFNVKDRLKVIGKLDGMLGKTKDKDKIDFLQQRINAQASFIKKYIDKTSTQLIGKIKKKVDNKKLNYFPMFIFVTYDEQIDSLKKQNEASNEKYKVATEQIDSLKKQNEATNEKYKVATEQIDKLDKENKKLKNELNQTKNKLAQVYASISYRLGRTLVRDNKKLLNPVTLIKKTKTAINMLKQKNALNSNKTISKITKKHYSPPVKSVVERERNLLKEKRTHKLPHLSPDKSIKELKIACIMDPFTYGSYAYEANFMQLTPQGWQEEIEKFSPNMLFIESAWRGKDELWWNTVGKKCDELVEIVTYCKQHSIPTVFWNKEDPVHFNTFINTASLFDFVFTTDMDMIERYKSILGHEQVYLLPFASQPKVNNPIEKYPRKDAFCFAGAYYVRYPDRTKDLEEYMQHLPSFKPIEIYDRNFGQDDPTYMFPDQYKQYIVGTLPFEEIDKAYKGYNYAINLNSVKQSQSMFARRVYEVLASNTITVSNFSRAVRLLFGDLVVTSDIGKEIVRRVDTLTADNSVLRKHKLIALRKVLSEHTYMQRLEYIISKVFNKTLKDTAPHITMVAYIKEEKEYEAALDSYQKQVYGNKSLIIFYEKQMPKNQPEDIILLSQQDAQENLISAYLDSSEYVALLDVNDYYGSYYLKDLSLATSYYDGDIIGKKSHYLYADKVELLGDGAQYTMVSSLPLVSSIVKKDVLGNITFSALQKKKESDALSIPEGLAIDEFNYCKNGYAMPKKDKTLIDATDISKSGISIHALESFSKKIDPFNKIISVKTSITGETLAKNIVLPKNSFVELGFADQNLKLLSSLEADKRINLFGNRYFDIMAVEFKTKQPVYFDIASNIDLMLLVEYNDSNKKKISHQALQPNRNLELTVPDKTKYIRFGFRIKGTGDATVYGLELEHKHYTPPVVIGQAEHLVLTNIYPSYTDLYRNGFVHARVKAYINEGVNVDVFQIQRNQPLSFYEFENVDIMKGSAESLHSLLKNNHYKSVLVHFLDPYMWDVLKEFIDEVKVYVWAHGFEIQSWHRRSHNFTTSSEIETAKILSDKRQKFWKPILENPNKNMHFIFVSQYLADNVMEDLNITIPKHHYSIIHNHIDTELFEYKKKDIEQRKKILSIRPYANANYANDLSVKAILELSKKPYFEELEFHMIGDGTLFDEILEPLRKFDNVFIEKRFLSRTEIAKLHKEYGIFLCPTRMDTHGVSRDEAMSSGLIPLTNGVTAIPEFVDEKCGILAEGDDAHGLAEGIEKIYEDPELFLQMSEAAAKRVRSQCGYEQTIQKELALLNKRERAKIMIFGSCVSRDILNIPNTFILTKYYARSSFASIFQVPFLHPEISKNLESKFQENVVRADMTKEIVKELKDGDFDILLLDFIDERFSLFLLNDSLCTLSNEAVNTGIKKEYPEHTIIKSGSEAFLHMWEQGWNDFIALMQSTGQLHKIMLNKVYWAEQTILGDDFMPTYSKEKVHQMNHFLDKLYTIAEKSLSSKNMMVFEKDLMLGADAHQWGKSPFHYVDKYYEKALNILETKL